MRPLGVDAQAAFPLRFVFGVIPVKKTHLALTLECQNVGRYSIQKPAVVADDDGAAGAEFSSSILFERADRIHVQIVGRLVEEQDIGALLQHAGEVNAISFAAGEGADDALLIGATESEAGDVGARVDGHGAELEVLLFFGDRFPDVYIGIEVIARLLNIGQLDALAETELAGVAFFLAGDETEERGFAGAVGSDDADDRIGREDEIHVLEEDFVAVGFGDFDSFDDLCAQTRAGRDIESRYPGPCNFCTS